jgi:hypothetical protein
LLDASSKNLVSWLAVFLFLERVRDSTEIPPHPILKQLPTSSEPYAAAKRDVIARGILTNWEDLARKLRAISTPTPANAKPIQWKYSDSTRRIRSNVASAKCHEQFSNCHRHA